MPPTQANPPAELSDEEIQQLLAGEAVRGPRTFRGRELAPLTRGLRAVLAKVVYPEDPGTFCDCVLLYILAQAHASAPEQKLARRTALLVATDAPAAFRAAVSLEIDDYSQEDIREAQRLVDEVLRPVDVAEVAVASELGKKKEPSAPGKLSRTRKRARR